MYTIFVNDCPLYLCDAKEKAPVDFSLRYLGKSKIILQATTTLEGGGHPEGMALVADDLEELWNTFKDLHRIVEAAGGCVWAGDKLLCIYRLDKWDLPKGKIEKGEGVKEAALREVEEETQVTNLKVVDTLPTTYHTYLDRKGRRVLKPTYWFQMTAKEQEVVPQTEEGIVKVEWVPLVDIEQVVIAETYKSLMPLIQASQFKKSI